MSTWKKAMKAGRREYKERHQPEERKHLGLLEKKEDYKKRANAYHKNEAKLKKLLRKAKDRNPDEFHFHMINSEIRDGVHYEKPKPEEHTEAQIKLMQTQDLNYINLKLSTELKKIEKLKASIALLNVPDRPKNTHTFYVDSKREAKKFNVAKHLNTHPALLDVPYNRPKLEDLKKMKLESSLSENLEKRTKHISQQYNELSKRIERAEQLRIIKEKWEMKKNLLGKNEEKPKLIRGATTTTAPVYKWKKERKR